VSFEPELGMMAFSGSPWEEHKMQSFVERGLRDISEEIGERRLCNDPNDNVEYGYEPADNCAAEYENDVFQMRSYCWCDNTREGHENGCPPNFKYGDFEARWYKYLGRGSSQNKTLTRDEWRSIYYRCIASLSS